MTTQFLTFALAGTAYAIPLERVREVVGCKTVVRVPNAGEFVRGVMNLRGSVVPVIDLARRIGAGDTTLSDTTCAVLMETDIDGETSAVAGLVEEIRSILELESGAVSATPEFGTPADPRLVRGVSAEGEPLVFLLDLNEVFVGIS